MDPPCPLATSLRLVLMAERGVVIFKYPIGNHEASGTMEIELIPLIEHVDRGIPLFF